MRSGPDVTTPSPPQICKWSWSKHCDGALCWLGRLRCVDQIKSATLGHDVYFLCFSSNFFVNQCGSAEKTNKPPKNKHGTSQRKCEMWSSRSVRQRYRWDIIDEKQLISTRPPSCSAAKKKKDIHLRRSLLPLFRVCSLSLSPDQWARTHRHSERTCAREWLSDGRTSSSFFSVKFNVLPTKAITQTHKKTVLGISPRRHVPESTWMSPSAAPVLQ